MNSRIKALALTAVAVGTVCGTAEAAFYNANFGGGGDGGHGEAGFTGGDGGGIRRGLCRALS